MRISRKKRPDKLLIPKFRINRAITAPEVRVLDEKEEYVGVMSIAEALALADEKEMDLVEINPKAEPPVVRIAEFGQFKYQQEKDARKQKANSHESELKGIRLSVRISEHDLAVRQKQAEKFLNRGDKARIELRLRGRERAHTDIAKDVVKNFVTRINENFPVKFEQNIEFQGGKITATIVKK
jgi:translation initiation factor IF-3